MKRYYTKSVLLLSVLYCSSIVYSQQLNRVRDEIPADFAAATRAIGATYYSRLPAFNEWYRQLKGVEQQRTSSGHVLFAWPLRPSSDYDDVPNYYTITNYWDMNSASGETNIRDWQCGDRTYDGHNGVDIIPWPFYWKARENNYLVVTAAAPGIVLPVVNNQIDDHCDLTNHASNVVHILHADSSVSSYLHLKAFSNKVTEGDFVYEGQAIAVVASSGRTTNPHLHFMVQSKAGPFIEPFKNTTSPDCNTMNTDTWWQNQQPYWNPQLNRISTHWGRPSIGHCEEDESPKLKNNFSSGDSIFIYSWFRDMQDGDQYTIDILQPDGTNWYSSSGTNNSGHQSSAFMSKARQIPAGAQSGTWKVIIEYRSVIYRHYFTVNCIGNYTLSTQTGSYGRTASNTIESTAIAENGEQVRLQAGTEIVFKPGFHSKTGSTLKARIRDCNYVE